MSGLAGYDAAQAVSYLIKLFFVETQFTLEVGRLVGKKILFWSFMKFSSMEGFTLSCLRYLVFTIFSVGHHQHSISQLANGNHTFTTGSQPEGKTTFL